MDVHIVNMYKDMDVKKKRQKYLFINVWCKSVFDIYFTEFGTALTIILPILFQIVIHTVIVTARNL
jgi:hypothetical protein